MSRMKQKFLVTFAVMAIAITVGLTVVDFAFAVTLDNPLGSDDGSANPQVLIGRVIAAMLSLAGSLALLVFIWGGMTWILSGGNEDKISKGKQMILWASFGLALIFFSYSIIQFIFTSVAGTENVSDASDDNVANPDDNTIQIKF